MDRQTWFELISVIRELMAKTDNVVSAIAVAGLGVEDEFFTDSVITKLIDLAAKYTTDAEHFKEWAYWTECGLIDRNEETVASDFFVEK